MFGGHWVSELSVFTLSRSESGVSVVPGPVILGKELSCGGGGKNNDKGEQKEDLDPVATK